MASYSVPQTVRNNARRGLELRKKHGRGGLTTAQAGEAGIGSGVARARDLIGGSVSLETVKRMSAFFDRHRKNKDTPPEKGNGMISWLLWGGDAGDRWAKSIIKQEESKKELMKTVAGRKLPASAFLVVGDPTKVTTWSLPVRNADGSPDTGRMGAAWAALHEGYRGNKYEGEGKVQAIAKLRRMYAEQGRDVPSESKKELHGRMWVTTDKEGRYRWVAISSNSYQDREGEIVSQKALQESVKRGDKGDLLWWHEQKAVLGTCDFQMISGRMLIESGTFKSQRVGAAFAKLKGLGVSVGFRHPANEPRNGVYENIQIFERSILPEKRAANGLTSFGVM